MADPPSELVLFLRFVAVVADAASRRRIEVHCEALIDGYVNTSFKLFFRHGYDDATARRTHSSPTTTTTTMTMTTTSHSDSRRRIRRERREEKREKKKRFMLLLSPLPSPSFPLTLLNFQYLTSRRELSTSLSLRVRLPNSRSLCRDPSFLRSSRVSYRDIR